MRNWTRKKSTQIKVGLLGLLCFAMISCSISSPFFSPTKKEVDNVQKQDNNEQPSQPYTTSKATFTQKLVDITSGGLTFTIDSGILEINPKDEEKNGTNILDFAGTKGSACLKGFSIHDLSLALDAPVSYNGVSRQLGLVLHEDELYFRIGNFVQGNDKYSFAYKTTLDPIDTEIDNQTIDPLTGGTYRFSYGNLDVFIHDMIETITQNGEDVDDPISSSSEKSVFNTNELIASLDSIYETSLNSKPYFVMTIEHGDDTYKVGFLTDTGFNLSRIDFPAYSNGVQDKTKVTSNIFAKFSANIESSNNLPSFTVENPEIYQEITDSTALFKKIVKTVNKKQVNVDLDLSLNHYEAESHSETEGDFPEVNEIIDIDGNASLNFASNALDDIGLELSLASYKNNALNYSQFFNFFYDKDEAENANTEILLNYNNITKLKTSKTTIDALISNFEGITTNENITNENLNNIVSLSNYLLDGIDAIVNSDLLTNVKDGAYHDIVDLIEILENGTNYLKVKIDLSKIGMMGFAIIELNDATDSGPIAIISFTEGVTFSGANDERRISVSGTIRILPYEKLENPDDKSTFQEMSHLESLSDQLRLFANSGKADFSVKGYILKANTNDIGSSKIVSTEPLYNNKTMQGFTFNGGFRMDLENKKGAGSVTFTDRKEKYRNDHTLKIDIEGPEQTDSNGESTESDNWTSSYTSNYNNMLFEYNSKNVTTSLSKKSASGYDSNYTYTDGDGKTRTEPHSSNGLKGRFSIHSLNGILDVVRSFQDRDDGRLDRLFSALSSSNSLLDEIKNRQYSTLLTRPLIKSLTIGSNNVTTIEIEDWVVGTDGAIKLEIEFNSAYSPDLSDSEMMSKAGIKNLKVSLKTKASDTDEEDKGKYIYIEIGVNKVIDKNAEISMNWPNQTASSRTSNFTDYSSFKELAQIALNTFYLNCPGITTYHISGSATINASLGSWTIKSLEVKYDFYLRLQGKDIKLYGFLDVPVTSLANAQSGTSLVKDKFRYVHVFANFSPIKNNSFIILDRIDLWQTGFIVYTKKSKEYTETMTTEHFTNNILGWLVKFCLGLNDTFSDLITDTETGTSSLHGEDLISSFSYSSGSAPSWNIGINLGAAAHNDTIGSTTLNISTKVLNSGEKQLYSLKTNSDLVIASVIKVSLNLSIANISSGTYQNCWNNSSYKATHWTKTSNWGSSSTGTPDSFFTTYYTNKNLNYNTVVSNQKAPYNY